MSLSFRHRAGLVLAGLVIGAPLVGAVAAAADTTTITFSGQPLLGSTLSCPSTPSQTTLHVPAGTTVDFVNLTGKPATLWAGDAEKVLPDESLVPVTFNGGPSQVVVQMLPDCSLDLGKHVQMTVYVTAADGSTPVPAVTPTGTPRTGLPSSTDHPTPSAQPTTSSGAAVAPATSPTNDNDPFAAVPAASTDVGKTTFGPAREPAQPSSASGLLTLIATVGVVGVSAAAIRAIVAQRTTRMISA